MSAIRLRIGRIRLAGIPREQASAAEQVLRTALALLAEKLRRAPIAAADTATGHGVETTARAALELGVLAPDAMLGPGGAERLASMLYLRLRQRG